MIGSHTGQYAGLCIGNPKPGWEYAYGLNTPTEIYKNRIRGYEVVKTTDEDGPAYRLAMLEGDSLQPSPLDTGEVFQDIVCMRIRADRLAAIRREQQEWANAQLRGSARSYVGGASEEEIFSGHGQATRFARRDHALVLTEGDRVVEQVPLGDVPREG